MSPDLSGRSVIITGAGQGLGKAYAERLATLGANVSVADIVGAAAEETASEISASSAPGTAIAYSVDIAEQEQVERLVADVFGRLGRVDALINNAGGALWPSGPFEAFTREQWTRVLDVNLTGQWLCSKAVVPHMKSAGYGKLINVSSTMATRGYPVGLSPYIAAKAGVVGLTRALAQELGPFGITVNAIAPGYTPVPTRKLVHSDDAAARLRERMVAEQCLKRLETPTDLCGAVAFLVSPDSDFITGQVLNVDGGWVMG